MKGPEYSWMQNIVYKIPKPASKQSEKKKAWCKNEHLMFELTGELAQTRAGETRSALSMGMNVLHGYALKAEFDQSELAFGKYYKLHRGNNT